MFGTHEMHLTKLFQQSIIKIFPGVQELWKTHFSEYTDAQTISIVPLDYFPLQ